jgi:hypothetical protein
MKSDKPNDVKRFEFALAQLRHAYQQMRSGRLILVHEFAENLIAPQIATLERLQPKITAGLNPRCECGDKLTQCADCAVADYQASQTNCRVCCPTADEMMARFGKRLRELREAGVLLSDEAQDAAERTDGTAEQP